MLRLLGVLLLAVAAVSAADHHVEHTCRDLSCASRESLLSQISLLKKDVHARDQVLAESECTACYSNPCMNGGQCMADGKTGYRCDCPDDTSGNNCQNKIVCNSKSCGKNAHCFIQNHQINCACDFGYSGNAKKSCNLATRKICFNGDPHYNTFDGAYYDYQSTCPYIFSQPCKDELDNGYSYFSVKAKNEIQFPGDTVSLVASTQVVFYNMTIFVDQFLHVFVDGVQVHVPYYYPSQSYAQFSITLRNNDIVIKNDQFVEVDFHYGQLCMVIPDVPEFRGQQTLCGLAGNFDGNCKDDLVKPDGTVIGTSCRPSQSQTDEFADTWMTTDYTQTNPPPACIDGKTMTGKSKTCKEIEGAAADCVDIFNAKTGTGPFAACVFLGDDVIQKAYDSCIYDVCLNKDLRCNSLGDFVSSCQFALGGVSIANWRATTACQMNCPVHTTYTECASACPATCSAHDAPDECDQPCAEGCACDYGYVLDTTNLATVTCIPVGDCGCTDNNGNMHPPNEHWLSNDCSQANYCQNGNYFRNPYACQPNAHCGVANGDMACICDAGYEYNKDTNACDDIDECLDTHTCSADKGFGTCTNTPGSYYCTCNMYYAGHDCETFAPIRHCADLYKYHGVRDDGVYTVTVPVDASYGDIQVYCDMTRGDGGWTLIGNSFLNETAEKTLDEYAEGFGSAEEADLWLGLDLISLYTNYQMMSLRLNLFRCAHNGVDAKWTDCTYKQFSVSGRTDEYRVTIPEVCRGTEIDYYDGWARWDLGKTGPKFIAFDNDNSTSHCSETFRNTGWWYDTSYRCGSANLNGVRYSCDNIPQGEDGQTYLFWNGDPINKADMYIRPTEFPNYKFTEEGENGKYISLFRKDKLSSNFVSKAQLNFNFICSKMLRSVAILLLTAAVVSADDHVERTCRDLSCASRESLLHQISMLKKDVHTRDQVLADSDCTACYSNPCLNGGQCLPDGNFGYRCDCPEDTAGSNCEKQIVCDDKSCGKNANCFIQNHQTNCVCQQAYSGDPKKGCNLATRRICFNGDPHYQTFDGATYDYQATCPYIFSLPCGEQLGNGYSYYSVKAKNDIQNPGQTVSYVTSTEVVFYNKTIFVDRYQNVFVDDVQVHVPYSYPSQQYSQFSINYINPYIVINNDQFVQVQFRYSELCLTIPDVPEFRGATTLCGLAGNFDGDCKDDIVNSDGTVTPLNGCRPSQAQTDKFADSWRTTDYTQYNPTAACIDGETMTNKSSTCKELEGAAADCVDIFNAQIGKGPFAACQALGDDVIQRAYDSCIYDVCLDKNLRCNSLVDFVHSCQFAIGGVNVDNWRVATACTIDCPAHATYSECVSGCPATCAAHNAPAQCNNPCTEGCACDYGYVLDTTSLATVTCIPVDQCGCTDSNGNMHPANQHWLSNDCSQANYCQNGTYFKNPYACQPNAHCDIANGEVTCLCDAGFEYNKETNACDDIDECLDGNTCSAATGNGKCFNTPGSYYCECAQYYAGHDCENFAPSRHCADLFKYHKVTDDGAYTVTVPVDDSYGDILVYCDMTRGGGGWTLIGNSFLNETAEKTLDEYAEGFGSAEEADLWLGLDLISLYTNYQMMSLRLNLFRCAHNGVDAKWTDCTYKQFSVSGRTDEYRVTIPEVCRGTEIDYYDGWARWDLGKTGPKFIAFDNDNSTSHCSETFRNTGWWYDTSYRCGSANLNGVRYSCDNIPQGEDGQTYLFWNGDPINKADMYIRPTEFPNYSD